MLSACQWAWVTGSMDEVRIPFLYHKAATYQFAREQLQSAELAQSGDTMLAISALALTEVWISFLKVRPTSQSSLTICDQGRDRRTGRLLKTLKGYTICGEGVE